jgi:hypothetical protein
MSAALQVVQCGDQQASLDSNVRALRIISEDVTSV